MVSSHGGLAGLQPAGWGSRFAFKRRECAAMVCWQTCTQQAGGRFQAQRVRPCENANHALTLLDAAHLARTWEG